MAKAARLKHPSGRPIRRDRKRDWSMWDHRIIGFVCPRLNDPPVKRIQGATDIFAIGFIDTRDDSSFYGEDRCQKSHTS